MAAMIGRMHHVVLDCPDPAAAAADAGARVLALGAAKLAGDDVYADPAGHPFCLIPRPAWAPPVTPGNATSAG
jgi:Glyoxalase-like domain